MKNLLKNLFRVLLLLTTAIVIPVSAQKKPVKKPAPKPPVKTSNQTIATNGTDTMTATRFTITIEQGDRKAEISSEQFEERDGNTIAAGDNKLLLFFGASNKTDDGRFSFNAAIPKFAKGTYSITDIDLNPYIAVTSSAFSNAGALKAKSGTIEITSYTAGAGFVEGKFSGVCVSSNDDGTFGNFKISGSFRLRKRLE